MGRVADAACRGGTVDADYAVASFDCRARHDEGLARVDL
jgi:hypothetical protein